MIWAALPNGVKAALGGALVAFLLAAGLWAYIANERREAAAQERARIELEYHRNNAATRDKINQADRSTGNADEDHHWLCERFGIECVREAPTD
jgi:hypothetical protein